MTPQEFEYIRRAMQVLESSDCSDMSRAKILQTVSEICGKNATMIRMNLVDSVDAILDRRYQDLQNQKLVDILSK